MIAKIYDLEATVDSLKAFNTDSMVLTIKERFKLTLSEARLLSALADGKPHYKRSLYEYVYHDEFDNPPEMKIIDVFMSKIRKKIFPYGIKIETIHQAGYKLADREHFVKVVAGEIMPVLTNESPSVYRKKGENERSVLNVLITQMNPDGRTKITARNLAKKAGLTVPLLPIMTKLADKKIIEIKGQPTRSNKLAPWIVLVKARAL